MEKMERFCGYIVCSLVLVSMLWLGVESLVWTQPFFFYERGEYLNANAPKLRDGIKSNILFLTIVVMILVMIALLAKKWLQRRQIKFWVVIESIAIFTFAYIYILQLQSLPFADSQNLIGYAGEFARGNYAVFGKGEYLSMYPHQISITWFISILMRLFPKNDIVIVYQILNCICVAGILPAGYYIVHSLWDNVAIDAVYLCIQGACMPLLFYSAHVYGEIPSLFLTFIFLGQIIKVMQGSKRMLWLRLVLVGIGVGLALCFRKNTLIVVVAVCIIVSLVLICEKNIRGGYIALSVLIGCCFPGMIQSAIAGEDYDKNNAYPAISWIDIGLHEGSGFGIGAYDGLAFEIFERNDFDSKATEKEVEQCVRGKIKHFLERPNEMFVFYKEKILWQWLEPTYRCFAQTCFCRGGVPTGYRL